MDDPPSRQDDAPHSEDVLRVRCSRLESRLNAALSELDLSARQLATQQTRLDKLERQVSELRALLEQSRQQERRLLEELSDERRGSLRLLSEAQEQREQLEDELREMRVQLERVAPGSEPPRHSQVVRRDPPSERTADTVRPPPIKHESR